MKCCDLYQKSLHIFQRINIQYNCKYNTSIVFLFQSSFKRIQIQENLTYYKKMCNYNNPTIDQFFVVQLKQKLFHSPENVTMGRNIRATHPFRSSKVIIAWCRLHRFPARSSRCYHLFDDVLSKRKRQASLVYFASSLL